MAAALPFKQMERVTWPSVTMGEVPNPNSSGKLKAVEQAFLWSHRASLPLAQ